MTDRDPFDLETWASLNLTERRGALAAALQANLVGIAGVQEVMIEPGPIGREYDLTAAVETDVGRLRTPLWSHAKAMTFQDTSVHPANRQQFNPTRAIAEAAGRLKPRLTASYRLESRGLVVTMSPEADVERTWTAEHSPFRKRTAVIREDRVKSAANVDVRDLLTHFYSGPSMRVAPSDSSSTPFLLQGSTEAEGPRITLCYSCKHWHEEPTEACASCGSDRVETVTAAR